jgi:hypothetical protein
MSISICEYVNALKREGKNIPQDESGTYWRRGEGGYLVRMPVFDLSAPDPACINRLLRNDHAPMISYVVEPSEGHPANANLYICRDQSYSMDKLAKKVRFSIRKSGVLRFEWLSKEIFLANGLPAFRDSCKRNGLTDGTSEVFQQKFRTWFNNPANGVIGAWKDDNLIAYYSTTAVDDWVEIGGESTNEGLMFNPNNGLVDRLLTEFLVERKFRVVSYGLSSIQESSNAEGLHHFKVKVGFEAIPVRRVFVPHPYLRPLINRFSLALGHRALRIFPGSRGLRKGCGVLSRLVHTSPSPG